MEFFANHNPVLASIKREAKRIKKSDANIIHTQALDAAAKLLGYRNYRHAYHSEKEKKSD